MCYCYNYYYYCYCCLPPQDSTDWIDICYKIATIAIAVVNVSFAIWFLTKKDTRDNNEKEKDRKINALKSFILDYNLQSFYDFFNSVNNEFEKILKDDSLEIKQQVEENLATFFVKVRKDFLDILIAVDKDLYQKVLEDFDLLQAHLSNNLFIENQNEKMTSDERFFNKITEIKTSAMQKLLNFRG